jgi:hypothetical protein
MTLYFSNPGSFDIRALTTFGLTAKPQSENPFGRFGTGLKNAIAGVLRLGGQVEIQTTEGTYTFSTLPEIFRGKDFTEIRVDGPSCDHHLLPFTLSLGSHWEPWMIYREFRCNALDEGGSLPQTTPPEAAGVTFAITCPEIEAICDSDHFISGEPIARFPGLEVFPGGTRKIFYRGVEVFAHNRNFLFSYNVISEVPLTEDRTCAQHNLLEAIGKSIAQADDDNLDTAVSVLFSKGPEMDISWNYLSISPSESFKDFLIQHARDERLSSSARRYTSDTWKDEVSPRPTPMTAEEKEVLGGVLIQLCTAISLPFRVMKSADVSKWDDFTLVGNILYLSQETFIQEKDYWKVDRPVQHKLAKAILCALAEHTAETSNDFFTKTIWRLAGGEDLFPKDEEPTAVAVEDDEIPF